MISLAEKLSNVDAILASLTTSFVRKEQKNRKSSLPVKHRQQLVNFLDEIQRDYEEFLENWLPTHFKLATGTESLGNTHATLEERILRHIMAKAKSAIGNPYEQKTANRFLFFQDVAKEFREAIQWHYNFARNVHKFF